MDLYSVVPALVPVGSEEDQDFPAIMIQVRKHAGETIFQRLFDPWVGGFEVLEHVQVLLTILEILSQETERLEMVELSGSEKL